MSDLPHVVIYTDGACTGNPGPGGWGALIIFGRHKKELSGGEHQTTNNRMELTAAVKALNALKKPCQVDFYTDSEYLRKGITQWIQQWKARGWRKSNKKPVKNQDLWKALDEAIQPHQIKWHWVRGHTGQWGNERVDQIARAAIPKSN